MRLLTFSLADTLHAVDLSTVEGVARWEEVEGRGLPLLDLARWLGYGGTEEGEGEERGERRAPVVVMQAGGRRALMRVDRSGEVLEVATDAAQDPPEMFSRHLLKGVIEYGGGLLVWLDGEALVEEAWRSAGGQPA